MHFFQYDFPFVQVLRVKEVRFRLRFPTGFNYNDYNFSEIDYEIQRKQKQVSALTKSTEILEIDDIDEINSDSESDRSTPVNRPNSSSVVQSNKKNRPPLLKAKSFQVESKKKELKRTSTETSIDLPSSDSDSDDDSEEENGKDDDDDWAGEVVVWACALYYLVLLFNNAKWSDDLRFYILFNSVSVISG